MGSYKITDECAGCTLCAKNCPVNAITGVLKEKHEINSEVCIRCGVCGRLCARGAILTDKGVPAVKEAKKDWAKPVIDAETCAGCSLCIENCPKHCLALTAPAFRGDIRTVAALVRPEDCIACGKCVDACPIRAIKLVKPDGAAV